jgi:hypothetical protein
LVRSNVLADTSVYCENGQSTQEEHHITNRKRYPEQADGEHNRANLSHLETDKSKYDESTKKNCIYMYKISGGGGPENFAA